MSTREFEQKEYVDKLRAQAACIRRILELNSYDLISSEMRSGLEEQAGKAIRLREKLEKNEYEVAIVGLEKAGKSTFANAMMGSDILPSDYGRCTYTTTCIRFGDDTAVVEFWTWKDFEADFTKKLGLVGIRNPERYSFETLSLSAYRALFEKEGNQLYAGTVSQDIEEALKFKENISRLLDAPPRKFSGEGDLAGDSFKAYIRDPQFAIAVREITIASSQLDAMKNAVIYDVPGFDSPTQMHKDQTLEKMRVADAIILVTSAYSPTFTGPVVDIMRQFRQECDGDGVKLGDKLFVFANRADTVETAEALRHNVEETWGQLQTYQMLRRENRERLVVGSARAKLEEDGKIEGETAQRGLREKGVGNGIEEIIGLLVRYNDTERFEVLKKRIDQTQAHILSMFRTLAESKAGVLDGTARFERVGLIQAGLYEKAKVRIKSGLEDYRAELRVQFRRPNKPLTEKLLAEVISGINREEDGVTDAEFTRAQNAGAGAAAELVMNLENGLRRGKYTEIYRKFVNGVVNLAVAEHDECSQKILKIFEEGLEITAGNLHYEKIRENILGFIGDRKVVADDRGYYKSLVDRFADDLFQILLRFSYGHDERWRKFEDEKANFYSLAMFDENADEGASPDRQPLPYLILFHDRRRVERKRYLESALAFVEDLLGAAPNGEIVRMVTQIVFARSSGALDFLKDALRMVDRKKPGTQKDSIVLNSLDSVVRSLREQGAQLEDAGLDISAYEKFFNGKRSKDPDTIRQEIDEDIEILHDILKSTVVNAIAIEKPFLALETQTIENLVDSLDSDFHGFVVQNMQLIAAEQFTAIRVESQKEAAQASILAEIENILAEMKVPAAD